MQLNNLKMSIPTSVADLANFVTQNFTATSE